MRRNVLYILIAVVGFACNPDDNDHTIKFPKELVATTEAIDMNLWVGGVEVSNAPDAEEVFTDRERGQSFYYIVFKNETDLFMASKGEYADTATVDYKFSNDSLILFSNYYFEEGFYYLGYGNYKSITSQRCAVMYHGYIKDVSGQIVDINDDEIINEHDKYRFTTEYDKAMSADDVAKEMGYSAASELEANDSIIIYTYSLSFLEDRNGDRIINEMDE